jgi:peptide deformylase
MMAAGRFVSYPDKRLKTPCVRVQRVDGAVRGIWDDMLACMYGMPGVGLAACQIGVMQRLAVMDCSDAGDAPVRMANPEVLHASVKLRIYEEASPNLPHVRAKITRPRAVTLGYLDETGAAVERDFVGLWATSAQHQIDHLNGRMYFDHLSPVKRRMLIARSMKLSRRRA